MRRLPVCLLGTLVVPLIIGSCTASRTTHSDLAEYAARHQQIPQQLALENHLPPLFEGAPIACGNSIVETAKLIEAEVAKLPESQRETFLALFREVPVERKYRVDLRAVTEVRTAWLAGERIVILQHPVQYHESWGNAHQPLTLRLRVGGEFISGAGPVTIWRGNKLFRFVDGPWVLLPVDRSLCLVTVADHLKGAGPVELSFWMPAHNASGEGIAFAFVDAGAEGGTVELSTIDRQTLRIVRTLEGIVREERSVSLTN